MLLRILFRSGAAAFVARGLAAAMIAGIGMKLGADAYEGAKRRLFRMPDKDDGAS